MHETELRQSHPGRPCKQQRGFALAFVFVLVALLLIIAILVITGAFNAGTQAQAVGIKYGVLNSAEAAANLALNRLADNPSQPVGCVNGILNGAAFRSCLGDNNLAYGTPSLTTDYANGQPLYVPAHAAYIYGEATNNGARKVYVEAIAQPAPPLGLPTGALNAANDINDLTSQPINQDPLHPNDANINANNNINVSGSPSVVQGLTQAVGTDSLTGSDGKTHSNASPVIFPNSTQVVRAAQNAKLIAQAGATYAGATISAGGTATYSGNVYVGGDVNLTAGTVTFAGGNAVYIDGNLCISGTGAVVNKGLSQSIIVVNGVVSSVGPGGYSVPLPANTLLLALATDPGAISPCGGGSTDAVYLAPTILDPIATIYAANGSVKIAGTGTVQGALDAGVNIDVAGVGAAMLQYDANQQQTTMSTGTMSYTAYSQY